MAFVVLLCSVPSPPQQTLIPPNCYSSLLGNQICVVPQNNQKLIDQIQKQGY
uniref:Uncharacterized protein n=1 Tax=Helianthus annuus TaxID=4232 RepID=A0A251TDL7_HELAN